MPNRDETMTLTVHSPVFFMRSAALTAALKRHIGQKAITGIVIVGHQAGEEGIRQLLKAVIPSHRHRADTVLIPADIQPLSAVPIRGIFDDVATGAEFLFLPEKDLVEALRSHDFEDRAVGASYSPENQVMTFITGDRRRVIVPSSDILPNPVMGKPDFTSIAVTDGGHTVTFGSAYEVAFDGLRYNHDPAYRKVVRKRARDKDRSFGACLRRARFHKGLGQDDFGITDRTIRRIESGTDGEGSISRRTKQFIERRLGMSFEQIKSY
jgi:hypothetical protein